MSRLHRALGLAVLSLLGAGPSACLDAPRAAPADAAPEDDTSAVEDTAPAPIAVDLLWVVNNSASSCGELQSFGDHVAGVLERIAAAVDIDPRVAVTGDDIGCDPDASAVAGASRGRFNPAPATSFPPPCQEQRLSPCAEDADCSENADPAWRCIGGPGGCDETPGGAPLTRCVRRCVDDDACRAAFGDPRYVCQKPSQSPEDWGCVLPPPSDGCPDTLPPWLDADHLDWLPCAAAVTINQERCMEHESAFRTAHLALDPTGPNAAQANAFRRPDAWLVIAFVSDEDDCSAAEGEYVGEDWVFCPTLPTTDDGGPLLPVAAAADRLEALAPGRVAVVAVAGDSRATDASRVAAERSAYLASRRQDQACSALSYVCASDDGPAGYGWRYRRLTERFGARGAFVNICDDPGAAYDAVADHIIQAVTR